MVTGSQIRRLRLRLKLSQPAFAKRLGVYPASVYRWEHDRARPSPLARQALLRLIEEVMGSAA